MASQQSVLRRFPGNTNPVAGGSNLVNILFGCFTATMSFNGFAPEIAAATQHGEATPPFAFMVSHHVQKVDPQSRSNRLLKGASTPGARKTAQSFDRLRAPPHVPTYGFCCFFSGFATSPSRSIFKCTLRKSVAASS